MQQTEASRFLERAADEPWSWEASNCLTILADWVDERRGTALGPKWRARKLDEEKARKAVARGGGMFAFVGRIALSAGLERIEPGEAQDGDIGLVTVATFVDEKVQTFEIGALRCGNLWGARTMHGVMAGRLQASAVWRV